MQIRTGFMLNKDIDRDIEETYVSFNIVKTIFLLIVVEVFSETSGPLLRLVMFSSIVPSNLSSILKIGYRS